VLEPVVDARRVEGMLARHVFYHLPLLQFVQADCAVLVLLVRIVLERVVRVYNVFYFFLRKLLLLFFLLPVVFILLLLLTFEVLCVHGPLALCSVHKRVSHKVHLDVSLNVAHGRLNDVVYEAHVHSLRTLSVVDSESHLTAVLEKLSVVPRNLLLVHHESRLLLTTWTRLTLLAWVLLIAFLLSVFHLI
jgi:hypothetical protein